MGETPQRRVEDRAAERDGLWGLSRDAFVITDRHSIWLAASPAWTRMLGWTEAELLGRTSEWLEHPDDRARTAVQRLSLREGEQAGRFVNRFRCKDGGYRWLEWNSVAQGQRFYHVARDVTEEREQARALEAAEEALRQSQKLESIGQITGGVAHDFNNLLTPIIATLDMLHRRGVGEARPDRMVSMALEASERARVLVQRLLAFARRQPLRVGAVDVAALVVRMRELIGSTLGPQIELEVEAPGGLSPALADANQLELALLNLAVNARDAMPDGGRFSVSVREAADAGGGRIAIRVADTGVGMAPAVLARAIEPFFSTKGLGRGTGLGLSMVHGLVAQLGGDMRIESAPNTGTSVVLELPLAVGVAAPADPCPDAPSPPALREILLVDDEPFAREATAQMLADLGYAVVEAGSADEALELLGRRPSLDALVTDQLMPGMSGTELARRVKARWPQIALLVVSGYAGTEEIAEDLPRLGKPFRPADLARALATAKSGVAEPASPP